MQAEPPTIETNTAPGRGDVDSNLALLNYCLLFVSVVFAGLPAVVAAIIAYVQRDSAPPGVRSHYSYQIRIFWIGLALAVIAALAAVAALAVGVSQLADVTIRGDWDGWDAVAFEGLDISIDPAIVALLGIAALAGLAATFWMLAAPVVGFIRLATQRSMGDRAA